MKNTFIIHVRTVTGLEEVLAEELTALGATHVHRETRLVICQGDMAFLYKANLWCRAAIRVLRPLASFPAPDEKSLYKGVREIDWTQWISPSGTLAVDANVHSSFTTHSLYASQLLKDAVVDQFRDKTNQRPSVSLDAPDLRIALSLFQDTATIYVDSSGDSLHKRGYRRRAGAAPISETLAAGIIKLSGWDGTTPLLDPMCGSGTFGIEAGLIVRNIAPGLLRKRFGFQGWKDYDRGLFESLVADARAAIHSEATAQIIGVDNDANMVEIARENVERAGLSDLVKIEHGDFFLGSRLCETPGTIVLNPPYDERLEIDNIGELYQSIGDRLKQAYGGWKAFVLAGNKDAMRFFGLRTSRRILLFNGAIECRLLEYELRASTGQRPERPTWQAKVVEENPKWKEKRDTFANRLRKNWKHYTKWAKREGISCWRVYDWDIPELPFIVDIFGDSMHFGEIPRNFNHTPYEHQDYMRTMLRAASEITGIPVEKIHYGKRPPEFREVTEGTRRFLVNLSEPVEVGMNLEQRKTREFVQKEAAEKDVLDLFAYTATFSVSAAAGGAKSTTAVEPSSASAEWAQRNFHLNGFTDPKKHQLIQGDTLEFLESTPQEFDLAVVQPPPKFFDREKLLKMVSKRLRPGGRILFSTSDRTFDEKTLKIGPQWNAKELTSQLLPLDFEGKPRYRSWLMSSNPKSN